MSQAGVKFSESMHISAQAESGPSQKGVSESNEWSSTATMILIAAFSLYLIVLVRTAWVCDDAFITLRTVDNFIHGHGLTWNVAERVQAYTHPLWMLLLSAVYLFTGEAFYTTLFTSIVISLVAALILVVRIAGSPPAAILAVLTLVASKSFMDFSTGGLENPLSHLLLAIFLWCYFSRPHTVYNLSLLMGITSLAMLCRNDMVLFYAPPLLYFAHKLPLRDAVRGLAIGLAPLLLWELFSFWYYGLLVPNTAYAKLSTGIAASELWEQGWQYVKLQAFRSPVTIVVILCAIVWGGVRRDVRRSAVAVGILLYGLYIVRIGGDFMQGRFFASIFFAAVCLLATYRFNWSLASPSLAALVILLFSFMSPTSPIYSGKDYGTGLEKTDWFKGISDERGAWFQVTGLLTQIGEDSVLDHTWVSYARKLREKGDTVVVRAGVGFVGYFAGPQVHIIDPHALTDPLLSRIPARTPHHWRVGHYTRLVPEDYIKSIKTGRNEIENPALRKYLEGLWLLSRGALADPKRIWTAVQFAFGTFDDLLDRYTNRLVEFRYDQVSSPLKPGTPFNHYACTILNTTGVAIIFDSLRYDQYFEASLNHNDDYLVRLLNGPNVVDSIIVRAEWTTKGGLRVDTLATGERVNRTGFDRIIVAPYGRHWSQSFGHLRLF